MQPSPPPIILPLMCGRVRLSPEWAEKKIKLRLGDLAPALNLRPSWNIPPTRDVVAIRAVKIGPRADRMRWGWFRIGDLVEPLTELAIEVVAVAEAAAEEEILADVTERPLDLTFIWHGGADASISLPHPSGRRYGETIRDVGRQEHASAGRPSERHGLRARTFRWSPLRLARMRCERGSVVAV